MMKRLRSGRIIVPFIALVSCVVPIEAHADLLLHTGTYTGNGSATQTISGISFQPEVVIIAGAGTGNSGAIKTEDMPTGASSAVGTVASGVQSNGVIDNITSDGFVVAGTTLSSEGKNVNAQAYYYIALGGSDVVAGTYTGTGTSPNAITGVGFQPELVITSGGATWFKTASMPTTHSAPFLNNATSSTAIIAIDSDGFSVGTSGGGANASSVTYYYVAITGDNIFTGTYTGDGSSRNITGVGFDPDVVVTKRNVTSGAMVRTPDMGSSASSMYSIAPVASSITALITDGFSLGTSATVNNSGNTYYYFALGESSDITAPTTSLTAPADGATVSGTSVTISANASDNVGVVGVQFKLNNVNIGSEDTSAPYSISWDSTATTSISHSLVSVARDLAGNYATSTARTITVDNAIPIISSISSGTPALTTATITWTTNENATSAVEYGTTSSYGSQTATSSAATSHSIVVTGLTQNTLYHYRVRSADGQLNFASSTDQTFTTSNTVVAPTLTTSAASLVATTTATLNGSIAATGGADATQSGFAYGTNATLDTVIATSTLGAQTGTASFNAGVTSLSGSTTYYFRAYATNSAGTGYGSILSFTTSDITIPVISSISAGALSQTTATITWNTNESATSAVEYGITSSYGSQTATSSVNTSHSIGLSGLTANTLYHYRVRSADGNGNFASSTNQTFTTNEDPPVISAISSGTPGPTTATVTWTTNKNSTSAVEYGLTTSYGSQTATSSAATAHSRTISGLTANTLYNYRVRSADSQSNFSSSTNRTFTTAPSGSPLAPLFWNVTPIVLDSAPEIDQHFWAGFPDVNGDGCFDAFAGTHADANASSTMFIQNKNGSGNCLGSFTFYENSPSGNYTQPTPATPRVTSRYVWGNWYGDADGLWSFYGHDVDGSSAARYQIAAASTPGGNPTYDAKSTGCHGNSTHCLIMDIDGDGSFEMATLNRPDPQDIGYVQNITTGSNIYTPSEGGEDYTIHIAVFDVDNDGVPEIINVVGGGYWSFEGGALVWNDAKFDSVSVPPETSNNHTVVFDYNKDGYQDLYVGVPTYNCVGCDSVAHAYHGTNLFLPNLFRNNGDGTFTNVTSAADLGTADLLKNTYFHTNYANTVPADIDLDGDIDLVMAAEGTAHTGTKTRVTLILNDGDGTFTVNRDNNFGEWTHAGNSNGRPWLNVADYDNDGRLDIVKTHGFSLDPTHETIAIYQNVTDIVGNNWLRGRARGLGNNTDGLHTRIVLKQAGTNTIIASQHIGVFSQGHQELTPHFGVGDRDTVDVEVHFPHGGPAYRYLSVPTNRDLVFFRNGNVVENYSPGTTLPMSGSAYSGTMIDISGAPTRSSGAPSGALSAGTENTTISLTTNEHATCKYALSANTAYASMGTTFSTTGGTSHSTAVSGLTNGTSYIYYVRCTDGVNVNTDDFTISFSVATPSSTPASSSGGRDRSGTLTKRASTIYTSSGERFDLINGRYVATPSLTPTTRPTLSAPSTPAITRNLSLRQSGEDVRTLQRILIERGHLAPGNDIGVFGPLTRRAIISLQQEAGLPPTGFVGPLTRELLSAPSVVPATSALPASTSSFTRDLQVGTTHSDVRRLQEFLNEKGFTVGTEGPGSKGNETTFFGPATREALIRFQKENNITPAEGYWGPRTRALIGG